MVLHRFGLRVFIPDALSLSSVVGYMRALVKGKYYIVVVALFFRWDREVEPCKVTNLSLLGE